MDSSKHTDPDESSSGQLSADQNQLGDEPQTLLFHLIEMRGMLLRIVGVVLGLFVVLMPFGKQLFTWASQPLVEKMPANTSMIATEVVSGFLIPIKLSFFAAVFIAMPFILYQLWGFVAPGLYQREKKTAIPLLLTSIVLFYLGTAFVYYIVFPLVFAFILKATPDPVAVMTDISKYMDFMLALFMTFGLAFEVPIATVILVWVGITTPDKLAEKRPYILIGAFILGMFLTPPDIISQVFLAVPMYILFELGIFMSRRIGKQKDRLAPTSES